LIEQFISYRVAAIKISPHIHRISPGLVAVSEQKRFSIYRETDSSTGKDTSRMLKCGAEIVYYVSVTDEGSLPEAFFKTIGLVGKERPVICESPSLIRYVEPGMFAIMIGDNSDNTNDISELRKAVHVEYTLAGLSGTGYLPFSFEDGRWRLTAAR
jgi:hypothetical protein